MRQVLGWRDFVWNLYWYFGAGWRRSNALAARRPVPRWFQELDADAVEAHCLNAAGARPNWWSGSTPASWTATNG
ncbi:MULTISPECIES: hypothetical protein [unclassified Micromonospora]|uniref:hypothetical protein n=1 Tax=unclassified Micromonospora TaxID=2617518 RepID=UPI00363F6354